MSKITVTTIAGQTSGSDANVVKIESGDSLTLGDNDKIKLGTSADLQIYHDGSNSYIDDGGTGNLRLRASNLFLQNSDNSKQYITMVDGGATSIHHDGVAKITSASTGVNITGGIGLGGTGSANILDDYEEGTFTPNIGGSGVAYGTQTGVYRKIGSLVYVYLQISINTIGSPATTSGILGLPFTPTISNQYMGITYATGLNSNYYEIHGNFRSDTTIRTDGKTSLGSGQNSGLSWAKAGAAIYGSGCYYTDA